ncbi:CLOCK-interacting pacemaker-like isoform X2 [Genypterus blacodes]
MPKEHGHFGERVSRSTSKNAKDKSNSATLRASQGGAHREMSGMGNMRDRMSRCDSEKDSGYSEAGSESVHTDVDDQRSSVSEPHRGSNRSSNSKNVNSTGHNNPAYEKLTPLYVIKNVVVKPSRTEQLFNGPLAWGGGWHSLTGTKAPTQLLLIQQPAIPAPSSSAPASSSSLAQAQGETKKGGGRSNKNHSSKNSYLPILNSFPRIAPHPRKESHVSTGGTWMEGVKESGSEGQSQSKRVCTEQEKREAVSTTKPQQQHQKDVRVYSHSQYIGRGGISSFTNPYHCLTPDHASSGTQSKSRHCQQSSRADSVSSPSVSSSQTPSPLSSSDSLSSSSPTSSSPSSSVAHSPYHPAPETSLDSSLSDSQSERQRRFLNTADILNQSGLLAITLRTKELQEQNAATEREIAQLRQHTHLLCQVAQANQQGCNVGSDNLDKLLQAMNKSGSYPNLDSNHLKTLSSNHQQNKNRSEEDKEKDNSIATTNLVSICNIDDGTLPPSPLFAPSPETEGAEHGLLDFLSSSISISFPCSVSEEGQRQADMYKELHDLNMLPESFTHNNYLL